MSTIGNLSFGIGGDDKELRKILDARKKDAIELQKIFSSFQLGSGRNTNQINEIVRLQEKQNRLEISNLRLQETKERVAANSIISQQRINQATERSNALSLTSLKLDADRLAAQRRIQTETERTEAVQRRQQVSAAQLARIEQDRINNQRLAQQRLLTEIERTAAARQQVAIAGVTAGTSYNHVLGLTNKTLFNQKQLLMQLSNAMGIYFSVYQVGAFVKELALVSGEFEKQRLSLAAILQNKMAADRLFAQIKDLAVVSPFNFKELTSYAKQLSAFSIPTEELYGTMKRLADISAGLGVDMQRIILAYGQVRSASVLRGQELRQFTEAGIPLVDELANKFTKLEGRVVSAGEVFDKISERQVPFAMIKEIFEDLTNEGGKFYRMQEIQAQSLAGMISNLRDAYDIMLDSIGSANSELLKGAVSGLVEVMDNWERYWQILRMIIVGYGTYKAAIIASTITSQAMVTTIKAMTVAQTIFNAVSKVNPYALAFAGIVALIGGLVSFINTQNEAREKLLSQITDINNQAESVNKLVGRLKELTKANKDDKSAEAERAGIIKTLLQKEPELANAIKDHTDSLEELTKAQERYNTMVDARKFAKYAISETEGFFEDGLVKKLENMAKAQNEADMNAVKLDRTYTHLVESWKEVKKIGGFDTALGKVRVTPERMKQIDEILASQKNHAEKVMEVYSLVEDAGQRAFNSSKQVNLGDANIAKRILGDYHKDNIQEYRQSVWGLATITKTANEDLTTLAKTLEVHFQHKGINVFDMDPKNQDQIRSYVKSLEELGEYGQKEILSKWNIKYELNTGTKEELDRWRKELESILGSTIHITTDSNFNEVVKEIKDKYKEVKTRIEEQKPILLNMGLNFSTNSFPSPILPTDLMKQTQEGYKADVAIQKAIEAAFAKLGINPQEVYKPKGSGTGSKKDKFTEGLKDKIDLIKEAKKQYEDLQKVMSKEDAFNKIKSIKGYEDISQTDISETRYKDYLNSQLAAIEKHFGKKPKPDTAKSLMASINKDIAGIDFGNISEKAKKEIDKIDRYLSGYKEKYALYKEIFEITGDKGGAARMVFGDPAASVETYIDAMKSQLKGMSGGGMYEDLLKVDQSVLTEPVRKMVEDIREAIQEQDFTLKVDTARIIADYATTEEKITTIHNRYEKLREEVRKSSASQGDKDKAVAAYDSAEHKEISELQDELLKLTPFYRQLFADLSDIGYRHLKKLSENARGIVDTITNTKVQTPHGERLKYGQYDESGKQTGYYLPNADGSVSKTVVSLKEYESILRKIAVIQKDMNKENPFQSLISSTDSEQYKNADRTKKDSLDILASKAADANAIVQELSGSLSGMFDALGNDAAADTSAFIGELMGAASNIATGIASGNPVQVIQGIVGGITSIAKNHDKKLDRAIEKSKIKVKGLQNAYSDLERFLSRQLGAVTSKQAKDQIKNLEAQRREIQSQMRNEQDKKKTDKGVVLDYQNQISELDDRIRYFYEDLAGEQFGIKIKDWAKNISDSLVDAWSKGEDAAKAFDKSVADIMKSVFKNVLQLQYIEPAMKNLRRYLFGEDGKGGVLGDGQLSQSDMSGLVKQLSGLKGDLDQWKTAWDYLTHAAKQAGIDLEEKVSSDGTLSKGIEAVTEGTASLLASYINGMRADLSMQRAFVQRILQNSDRNTNAFALMQADIMLIQMNTLRTANNTDRLVQLSEDTFSILRNASVSGSGVRFNIA